MDNYFYKYNLEGSYFFLFAVKVNSMIWLIS